MNLVILIEYTDMAYPFINIAKGRKYMRKVIIISITLIATVLFIIIFTTIAKKSEYNEVDDPIAIFSEVDKTTVYSENNYTQNVNIESIVEDEIIKNDNIESDEEDKYDHEATVYRLLTSGEWVSLLGDTVVTATHDKLVLVNDIKGDFETSIVKYVVNEVQFINGDYHIKWTLTHENGAEFFVPNARLTAKGNDYTLYSYSLPYAGAFELCLEMENK